MEIPSTETDATTMSSQSREQLTTVIDTLNQQFNQAPQQQQQGEWSQEGEIHLTTKNEIIIRPITWLDQAFITYLLIYGSLTGCLGLLRGWKTQFLSSEAEEMKTEGEDFLLWRLKNEGHEDNQ